MLESVQIGWPWAAVSFWKLTDPGQKVGHLMDTLPRGARQGS